MNATDNVVGGALLHRDTDALVAGSVCGLLVAVRRIWSVSARPGWIIIDRWPLRRRWWWRRVVNRGRRRIVIDWRRWIVNRRRSRIIIDRASSSRSLLVADSTDSTDCTIVKVVVEVLNGDAARPDTTRVNWRWRKAVETKRRSAVASDRWSTIARVRHTVRSFGWTITGLNALNVPLVLIART